MKRSLPLILAFVTVVGAGAWNGLFTDRWALSGEPRASAARIAGVSPRLGDWEGTDLPRTEREMAVANVAGWLSRRYDSPGKSPVSVLLLCGRPGPVSVHTPDVCYIGAGYEMVGSPERYTLPSDKRSRTADFFTVVFRKKDRGQAGYIRVFWSWSADGAWEAPEDPRWSFARHKALYKLYVIRELEGPEDRLREDPCNDFLAGLLPELDRALFAPR